MYVRVRLFACTGALYVASPTMFICRVITKLPIGNVNIGMTPTPVSVHVTSSPVTNTVTTDSHISGRYVRTFTYAFHA